MPMVTESGKASCEMPGYWNYSYMSREEQPFDRCYKLRLQTQLKSGLHNQHLALLSFLTVGVALGADELLIESSERRYHSLENFTFIPEAFETLWDRAQLGAFLQRKNACT